MGVVRTVKPVVIGYLPSNRIDFGEDALDVANAMLLEEGRELADIGWGHTGCEEGTRAVVWRGTARQRAMVVGLSDFPRSRFGCSVDTR